MSALSKSAFLYTQIWLWAFQVLRSLRHCELQNGKKAVRALTQSNSLLPSFCYFCLQTAIQLAFFGDKKIKIYCTLYTIEIRISQEGHSH